MLVGADVQKLVEEARLHSGKVVGGDRGLCQHVGGGPGACEDFVVVRLEVYELCLSCLGLSQDQRSAHLEERHDSIGQDGERKVGTA